MKKKQLVILFLAIFITGGLGGVIANQYLFPYLSSSDFWSRYEFLKRSAERVTVINKTEQIFVKEENTVNKVIGQVSSSLVKVISLPDGSSQRKPKTGNIPTIQEALGFVATSDGLIVAGSGGIIEKDATYKVVLFNGDVLDGEFLEKDVYSGLAFFKVKAGNLTVASFANSDDIRAGEKVVAFGKGPGDETISLSYNLISHFDKTYSISGKTLSSSEVLEGVYKLDGFVDKDFYGGVAADFAGQIVGMIGRAEKDGREEFFIIPSNEVKKVIEKSIKKELSQTAILGIYYVPLTKNYALIHNMQQEKGAYLYSSSQQNGLVILSGSLAEKAGLKIGDIITKVDNREIDGENPLSEILYQKKKGEKMDLTLLRNNEEIKIEVGL